MQKTKPRNAVRFIWFSAEESGLLGSAYYVSQLDAQERADIAGMLNFDMLASPNFVRFVYDGDLSSFPGPVGGLLTGAEVRKTAAQAAIYGGAPGEQFDPLLPRVLRLARDARRHAAGDRAGEPCRRGVTGRQRLRRARPDVRRGRPRHHHAGPEQRGAQRRAREGQLQLRREDPRPAAR